MRALILLVITGICVASAGDAVPFQIHGQAWTDFGRVVKSTDTLPNNVSHNSVQSLGGQLTIDADLGEHWSAALGMGAYQIANALGTHNGDTSVPNFSNVSMFRPYVAQASLTYFQGERANPWLSITAGNFAYDYNPDVKDLGLYLLRGPVYPGLLMSGFQEFDTDTSKSTQMGFHVHHAMGNFSHDLLFINERELPPMFDWSLAYVAKYRAFDALEIGAGVNFYRLVPYSSPLETVKNLEPSGDTVSYSNQGVKLMAMFSMDPKRWLPFEHLGTEDFKLYGEAAVLGVKNYGSCYSDIWQRIPVMMGFNVPTLGILDHLSLEVEWYGSHYPDDLANIGNPASVVAPWQTQDNTPIPSPIPVQPQAGAPPYADSTRDNWKWAVVVQKTVAKHVRFTAQIANDHYRPTPMPTDAAGISSSGGSASAFTSPSDWYFMCRLGFFF